MENQNIQWQTWEEQPQENNDQPQVNWGEQQHQEKNEQPQVNWGEQPTTESTTPSWSWEESESNEEETENVSNYDILESSSEIRIQPLIYKLNSNVDQALIDLKDISLDLLNNEGKYDFNPQPNSELGKIIEKIVKVGISHKLKVTNCFIYKIKPNEPLLNLNPTKPIVSFYFYLKSDTNGGNVIMDLTSISGPSVIAHPNPNPDELILIPGWIPTRISKNTSNEDIIIIAGNLN